MNKFILEDALKGKRVRTKGGNPVVLLFIHNDANDIAPLVGVVYYGKNGVGWIVQTWRRTSGESFPEDASFDLVMGESRMRNVPPLTIHQFPRHE